MKRRELRRVREYLRRFPYECRSIYYKFIDVKKNTNQLITEFVSYLCDVNKIEGIENLDLRYIWWYNVLKILKITLSNNH